MSFNTILGESVSEYIVEKSRFIAHIKSVKQESDALAYIESIKKMHYNARHNVPVYRIGSEGAIQKHSDDGEPAGTAGLPIIEMLKKEGLTNICVVVTRYFGGIKLGTGGLVRAYTLSVKNSLSKLPVLQVNSYILGLITVDYSWISTLTHQLEQLEIPIVDMTYLEEVQFTVAIENDQWDATLNQISEKSNGQIKCEPIQEILGILDKGKVLIY